ncbi:MAG: ATP-dependent endonuclease [Candidatus Hodarchaeota archaeon]
MRLKRLTIKNFRSISELEDFEFVDPGITCLIGGNGTGKSNILRAISYLKEEGPSDDEFYAKAEDIDDEAVIRAEFAFEDKDSDLLKSSNLNLKSIQGFYVTVEKIRAVDSTIELSPVGYKGETKVSRVEFENIKNSIRDLVMSIELTAEISHIKDRILNGLEQIDSETSDFNETLSYITQAVQELERFEPNRAQRISDSLKQIKNSLQMDINNTIDDVFDKLDIELLTFDEYEIENKAPIGGLNDNSQHPFLYDLLVLANRKASDFNVSGAWLQRRKESSSKLLSKRISEAWLTHDLDFNIDRQGDDLVFTVYTPQRQQIDLTDLSDGEQWFLRFYTRLAIAQLEGNQVMWLFDEPGRDLHSTSQNDLKRFFEYVSQSSQIIYTTHQAMMVPWHRLERIFVVENSDTHGTLVHRRFWKDTGLESPLKEALSTFVGEELFSGKQHIIVEGISDYFYIQGWLLFFQRHRSAQIWRESFQPLQRVMLPVEGVAKIPLYCWFLGRQTKNKVNWVAIVDSKRDEESTRKILETTGLGSWKENAVSIGDLAKVNVINEIEEIENLFTVEEYVRVFHEYYRETYPNCNVPTEDNIKARLSENKITHKITKVINSFLRENNPALEATGKTIELDKTGIARKVYLILTQEKDVPFCKETTSKFESVLRSISKILP